MRIGEIGQAGERSHIHIRASTDYGNQQGGLIRGRYIRLRYSVDGLYR